MARRKRVRKRQIEEDPKFQSKLLSKFINRIMQDGAKSKAQAIVYGALDYIGEKEKKEDPLGVFKQALKNVQPQLEVKSRRIGGATYQVPIEVKPERSITLAMRWIISNARARKGMPMREKLAQELLEAYKGEGASIKKREDTHRMAEANRAFAHYSW